MSQTSSNVHRPDEELDLRGVICPYNFVKTAQTGEHVSRQLLLVHLDDGDPIGMSMKRGDDGHDVFRRSEPINPFVS